MEKTASATIGKRIAAHRKRLGLTQDQLAERVGVSPQAVSKWENDLSCPDISTLPLLAEIFGVSTDELLGVAPKEAPVFQGEVVDGGAEENEPNGFHFNNGTWEFKVDSGKQTGIFFALWVIALGAMLLAGRLLTEVSFWTALWTTGLTVLGLSSLFKKFNLFGLTATLGGVYLILNALDVIPAVLSWDIVLPALIVIWGLSLLIDALTKKKKSPVQIHHKGHPGIHTGSSTANVEDGVFHYSNSFGEDHYRVDVPVLRGGEVDVSFGEHTIDFSGCEEVAENCQVSVSASFGELTLFVPQRFRVELEAGKAFSSIEVSGQPEANPAGTIYLDASVSFGEMKIIYT